MLWIKSLRRDQVYLAFLWEMFFKRNQPDSVKRSFWLFDFSELIPCGVVRVELMNIGVPSGNNSISNGSWGSIHSNNLLNITFQVSNWGTTEFFARGFINERENTNSRQTRAMCSNKQFSLRADSGVVFFFDKINLTYRVFFEGSSLTHFMPLISFYNAWKHSLKTTENPRFSNVFRGYTKRSGFLMFSGIIERYQWH